MFKMIKKLLPLLVLIIFGVAAYVVMSNPPTVKRSKPNLAPKLNVEVVTIIKNNLKVDVESYGTVKPRTQSVLYSQVSGQIIEINPKFREGGFFEKGEVLIELDKRDLLSRIQISKSSLFSAKQSFEEEKARAEQALQDWARLGNSDKAPDLVLRKPQLMAAEAKVLSADASLANAELALERTSIEAPYTGRILKKHVDIGQVVSSNTKLAETYAVDYVEIRLPIKNKDLPYVILPEPNRLNQADTQTQQPSVNFYSDLVGNQEWKGRIVRTEGALDSQSQQLFVVAQITDPYGEENSSVSPIKIGQYVTATIEGKTIPDAITIPNKAIYQGSYVYIVDDGLLKRKEITISWQNKNIAVLSSGINENDLLVLTPLGQVTSGMRVAISTKDGKVHTRKPSDKTRLKDRNGKAKQREDQTGGNDRPNKAKAGDQQ
jgi:RND family efflux transporter MFP subunit